MHSPAAANWIGLWTLYTREVRRFTKVYMQTILAPLMSTSLFLAVFSLALGSAARSVGNTPFIEFLSPGLMIMAISQNAFANTSSSLMTAKVQGSIVDTLMAPLTAFEIHFGLTMGGVTRGIVVGCAVALAMHVFVGLGIHSLTHIVFHAVVVREESRCHTGPEHSGCACILSDIIRDRPGFLRFFGLMAEIAVLHRQASA